MRYDVRCERADQRVLAAVRAATTPERLGADIVRLLGIVWPVLREQGVRTGHNVVVYYGADGGHPGGADGTAAMTVEVVSRRSPISRQMARFAAPPRHPAS